MAAVSATTTQSIVLADDLDDARSVDPRSIFSSQCKRPIKPKAETAEHEEENAWNEPADWDKSRQSYAWETEEYEAFKGKKGKGKRSKSKRSQRAKARQGQLSRDLRKIQMPDPIDLNPNPNLKQDRACLMDTCSP